MFSFSFMIFLCLSCNLVLAIPSSLMRDNKDDSKLELFQFHKHIDNSVGNFVNFAKSLNKKNFSYASVDQKRIGKKMSTRCSACAFLVNLIQKRAGKGPNTEEFKSILSWIEKGCEYLDVEAPEVCLGVRKIFGDEIVKVFTKVQLPAEEICGLSMPDICSHFHSVSSSYEWMVSLPPKQAGDLASNHYEYKYDLSRVKVLHLSDIHIDMKYRVGGSTNCGEPLCCRKAPPASQTKSFFGKLEDKIKLHFMKSNEVIGSKEKAMKWGDYRNCDLPWWTFDDLLKKLSSSTKTDLGAIDYIIFTGDLPAHDVWNQTKKQQIEIIFHVARILEKYFPNTPIFPAIGNHDSFPANSFPPHELRTAKKFNVDWVYSSYAKAWNQWLPKKAAQTMKKGGFYTTLIKPGYRIVSLNTNFCYTENFWIWLDKNDPEGMLTWFVEVLWKAEQKNELVQVIGHVPPGREPECMKTWSKNYFRIVERFRNTISAQFFGHTHYDEMQIFYDTYGEPISVAYLAPSVTSYAKMKPSYRIYEVEGYGVNSSWSVLNHQTYTMNFIEANFTDNPAWELEYDACKNYNITVLNSKNWNKVITEWMKYLNKEINTIPNSLIMYVKFYVKKHPQIDVQQLNAKKVDGSVDLKNIVCDVAKNFIFEPCMSDYLNNHKFKKPSVC